ncbi:hypothetical protein CHARACLAT_021841 [Characodon lateralis]|uniref:Uncharacterized protein n=1 Tax=Characodon lateralis TaxID=208331 RepID=A0ABU7EVN8_9TELE|nr:hypothetical protein [Characodon lateralis]
MLLYAFPPVPLIPRVLDQVREEQLSVILVAPERKSAPWFPSLQQLPWREDALLQAGGAIRSVPELGQRLWVWSLNGSAYGAFTPNADSANISHPLCAFACLTFRVMSALPFGNKQQRFATSSNRRSFYPLYHHLLQELRLDDGRFQRYFRLSRTQVEDLLPHVGRRIGLRDTIYRRCIPAAEHLSICLRFRCRYPLGATSPRIHQVVPFPPRAETGRPPQHLNLGQASLGWCLNLSDRGPDPDPSPQRPPSSFGEGTMYKRVVYMVPTGPPSRAATG